MEHIAALCGAFASGSRRLRVPALLKGGRRLRRRRSCPDVRARHRARTAVGLLAASRAVGRDDQDTSAPQLIPALIPAFFRDGIGFSGTSIAPIASIGAGLRGAVGCRDTHLGLVDHQQHDQNPSSTNSAARIKALAFASVSLHSISGS